MKRSAQVGGRFRPALRAGLIVLSLLGAGCAALDASREDARCQSTLDTPNAFSAQPMGSFRTGVSPEAAGAAGFSSLVYPAQIATSGDDLFVADEGLGQLMRVQRSTGRIRSLGRLPGRVSGMFIDPFRKLYMAVPSISAILQVSLEGITERVVRDAANLGSPRDVAVDGLQRIYAADGSDARVIVFDRLGQVTGTLGERLDAPNPFATTDAIAIGKRGIYVLDATARRLHVFSHNRIVNTIELASLTRAPSALAVDRHERLLVLDHSPERILLIPDVLTPSPLEVSNLGMTQRISDLWVDESGVLYIAEPGGVRSFYLPPPCK